MADELNVRINNVLVSGRKDETLTYARYVKDEATDKNVADLISAKADATEVDNALAKKADKEWVQGELDKKVDTSTFTTAIGKKADASDMEAALDKKADKTEASDLSTALGKKADKTDVENAVTRLDEKIEDAHKIDAGQVVMENLGQDVRDAIAAAAATPKRIVTCVNGVWPDISDVDTLGLISGGYAVNAKDMSVYVWKNRSWNKTETVDVSLFYLDKRDNTLYTCDMKNKRMVNIANSVKIGTTKGTAYDGASGQQLADRIEGKDGGLGLPDNIVRRVSVDATEEDSVQLLSDEAEWDGAEWGYTDEYRCEIPAATEETAGVMSASDKKTLAQTAADVAALRKTVETWVNASGFVGMARANGDTSPGAETAYGTAERVHEVGARWRLCTVKDGVVTHRCAPGRLTLGTLGEEVKIDGSDGDVMLCCEDGLELLKDTRTVDGRELNIIGLGTHPCTWYGSESKHLKPFGITPCATVNAKILDDAREQAHCVYNTDAKGVSAPAPSLYKAGFKKDGGGWPSGSVSCIKSIQEAQNKNADALTNRPWTGFYYEYYEAILAMMYAEMGTLDHTHTNLMGVGVTGAAMPDSSNFYDAKGSALSGWMLRTADGQTLYSRLWTDLYTADGLFSKNMVYGQLCQSGYAIVGVLEAQRVLDGISKAGLVEEIGKEGALFCFNDDGDIEMDDTVNPATGEGMAACKMYYQVRDVPHCEGMADGVMTAVVNRWVKLEMNDGILLWDKKTSMDGGIVVMKCSIPIYRGWTLPLAGLFIQTMGAHYVEKRSADGNLATFFACADDVDKVPPLTSFGETAYWNRTATAVPPYLLNGLTKGRTLSALPGEAWVAKANYGLSLLCATSMTGAGQHTKECAYLWLYLSQNKENGSTYVHGSVCGCSVHVGQASARSAACAHGAGSGDGHYAGAAAVLLKQ